MLDGVEYRVRELPQRGLTGAPRPLGDPRALYRVFVSADGTRRFLRLRSARRWPLPADEHALDVDTLTRQLRESTDEPPAQLERLVSAPAHRIVTAPDGCTWTVTADDDGRALTAETTGERRRVAPVPERWRDLADAELLALLASAPGIAVEVRWPGDDW